MQSLKLEQLSLQQKLLEKISLNDYSRAGSAHAPDKAITTGSLSSHDHDLLVTRQLR